MRYVLPLVLFCVPVGMDAQTKQASIRKNQFTDSAAAAVLRDQQLYDLPVLTLQENESRESEQAFVPSLLSANRDVFLSVAGFHFSQFRFRPRGYDGRQFSAMVNGIEMNDPDNGNTQWGLWSGLNEVTRNVVLIRGLSVSAYGFGNTGSLQYLDLRASKQRAQTEFGYTYSNRTYVHKWSFAKTSAFNKQGWSLAVSASIRKSASGYFQGTATDGYAYYFAVDKRWGEDRLLSLLIFGSATEAGRSAAVTKEMGRIAGNNTYNPNWGYQQGARRSASLVSQHMPVAILVYEYRPYPLTKYTISLGCISGEKSSTALDWYQAPDPRPDYYRYLPSYQQDTVLYTAVYNLMRGNESIRQLNWQRMYEVNRNSVETIQDVGGITGNTITGLRSHYWLADRVTHVTRAVLSLLVDKRWSDRFAYTAGASLQYQYSRRFMRVNDLLGGSFIVDLNSFAENNRGDDQLQKQNDLHHPNRPVYTSGRYGYDYTMLTPYAQGFFQLLYTGRKDELFAAAEIATKGYYREGWMQNGLFPWNSYGRSSLLSFTNYGFKFGLTHKLDGKHYLYLQAASRNRAPLAEQVFIAPRYRNSLQQEIRNESILHAEAGYICQAPRLKWRLTSYLTDFRNGMDILRFYHDGYRQFVNYALSGIGKFHCGLETGLEFKLNRQWQVVLAASVGSFSYTTRQVLEVSADEDAYILERTAVYAKNFHVEGAAAEAYAAGLHYQSANFYCSLTQSFLRHQWLAWNPLRRTREVMENVIPGSEQWYAILRQEELPEQSALDLSAGASIQVRLPGGKHRKQLSWYCTINNLLNKKDMIAGGYEQLRFDMKDKDPEKFPSKYYYAMGLNFSLHITFRL